jgi:hypothetical protein
MEHVRHLVARDLGRLGGQASPREPSAMTAVGCGQLRLQDIVS